MTIKRELFLNTRLMGATARMLGCKPGFDLYDDARFLGMIAEHSDDSGWRIIYADPASKGPRIAHTKDDATDFVLSFYRLTRDGQGHD